jgi:hypothetical protein
MRSIQLSYILTTGANWAGPIGSFHLTIDGSPGARAPAQVGLIAGCTEMPLHRSGPVRLEGVASDYVPRRDLNIMMVLAPP